MSIDTEFEVHHEDLNAPAAAESAEAAPAAPKKARRKKAAKKRGMRTLPIRVKAACAGAMDLAVDMARADIISMHAPVLESTSKMIGAEQFAAMKPGAIYINSARAALHDTDAMVASLQTGGGRAGDPKAWMQKVA